MNDGMLDRARRAAVEMRKACGMAVRNALRNGKPSEIVDSACWDIDVDVIMAAIDLPEGKLAASPAVKDSLTAPSSSSDFAVGDHVRKTGGDYTFEGVVVATFKKLSGAVRYVVEDDRGVLHVYSAKCLARRESNGDELPELPKPGAGVSVDQMVNRFLGWKLPKDFCPDAGISFKATHEYDTPHWPIGTNLFTAPQAKAMFEYVLAGKTPQHDQAAMVADLRMRLPARRNTPMRADEGFAPLEFDNGWNSCLDAIARLSTPQQHQAAGVRPAYTDEELKTWYPTVCPECGWHGLSRDCAGGGPIADTGDYDDIVCPKCFADGEGKWVLVEEDEVPQPEQDAKDAEPTPGMVLAGRIAFNEIMNGLEPDEADAIAACYRAMRATQRAGREGLG